MEQLPGPLGSPQLPHGAAAAWSCDGADGKPPNDFAGLLDCAAKTDSSFCRSSLLHDGHAGVSLARVRNSNLLWQPRHSYS